MFYPFSSYQQRAQLAADVDRMRPGQGVRLDDLFGSLQLYFGSQYINDFNLSAVPTVCQAMRVT